MRNRIKMNTSSLQEAFPEVYREFFSRCSIVTSTPGIFFWTGEYSVNFGGPAITQKLPVRVYVGIEPSTQKNKVEFKKIMSFIPSEKKFKEYSFDDYTRKKRIRYISDLAKKICDKEEFNGFKVHAIFEVPRASGLNLSSVFCTALVMAMFLYFKKCTVQEYQIARKIKNYEKLAEYKPFNKVFREAWKMNGSVHGGISSGSTTFEAMVHSVYPNLFFAEKRCSLFRNNIYEKCDAKFPCNMEDNLDLIDKIKYWAVNAGDFYGLSGTQTWPVDFGLIYSGSLKLTGRMPRMISALEGSLTNLSDFVNGDFSKVIKGDRSPFFFNLIRDEKACGLWGSYLNVLCMIGLDVFKSFKDVFKLGTSEVLRSFFRSISFYDDMVSLLDPGSPITDYIRSFLKENAQMMNEDIGIASKVTGSGRGGDVLFIAPHGYTGILKAVEKMRRDTGKKIWLDYASWEDGYEEKGLEIEQFIEEGIYSKFISHGSISAIHLNNKGDVHTDLYTIDEFEERVDKFDLFLDTVDNKISVLGKVLGSKEIYSARTTIEMLKILIENLGKDVPNTEFPRSSYSTSRNEFQSKIVIPLQKAMKKYYGKELNIIIHGNLYNFTVKLKTGDYHIHIIDRKF